MKIFGIEFRRASKKEITYNKSLFARGPFYTSRYYGTQYKPTQLSAVYRCVELIASAIAQLELQTLTFDKDRFPIPAVNHPAYDIFSIEPNADMTPYSFFHALMVSVILNGNGYAYIQRNKNNGQVASVDYLDPSSVSQEWVTLKSGLIVRRYRVVGFNELVEPKDMLHILNFTYDGLTGISTITHAIKTIGVSSVSEEHVKEFFDGGAAVNGILSVETGGRLKSGQREDMTKSWNEMSNPNTGAKSSIAVLDGNMRYQPISISPKDAQMLESRQFNVIEICRFFGVSPSKCFDFTKSSYSSAEAANIDFLTTTLSPYLKAIEQEINKKVFTAPERRSYKVRFNTNDMFRVDKKTLAEYNKNMFYIGAKSPNEIRREEGLSRMKGGDGTYIPVNVQPMELAGQIDSTKQTTK